MKTNWMLGAAVAMSLTAAVAAQSSKAMEPSKGDTMSPTYTGCVESVNHGGTFLLTNVDSTGAETMHDATSMKHEQTTAGQRMDAMRATAFVLTGAANVSEHVGQKVSVTGSLTEGAKGTMRQDLSTLTVKTLKVIAQSCS